MSWVSVIISLLIVSSSFGQDTSLFKREVFVKGKDSLNYRMLYPIKYDVDKKYPIVLFLHGAGERGSDNAKQLLHGSALFLDSMNRLKYLAAAFAICGGGDPQKVALYAKGFPIWVFHGGADNVVPVSNSRLMSNTLRQAGAKVKYTEYPGVGHNSWDKAFAEPDFLEWLFAQER